MLFYLSMLMMMRTRAQWGHYCRAAFDALIGKMHVTTLQTQPPRVPPKSTGTGNAFLPATAKVPTLAEAAALTEHLRHRQEAANQEVAPYSFCCPGGYLVSCHVQGLGLLVSTSPVPVTIHIQIIAL